jgi:hypothetical protein
MLQEELTVLLARPGGVMGVLPSGIWLLNFIFF